MAERLRAIVVDDEPLARGTLRRLLAADGEVELVAECATGTAAIEAVRAHAPDLLFLDVQMPGPSGFDVLAAVGPEAAGAVVFVTAYDRFAVRAFDVHAVDYLLKPFDDERFAVALARAKERARSGGAPAGLRALLGEQGARPKRLAIHGEGKVELVDTGAIVWIEAADQYVRLHTDTDVHLMRESLSRLEETLDPERFVRVHRSAIVATDRIRRLVATPTGVGRVQLGDDLWLPVARSRMAALRARLG